MAKTWRKNTSPAGGGGLQESTMQGIHQVITEAVLHCEDIFTSVFIFTLPVAAGSACVQCGIYIERAVFPLILLCLWNHES